MKKQMLVCLLAAAVAGAALGEAAPAAAVDFKVKGLWQYAFDYVDGGNFLSRTRAGQNVTGQQWAAMHQQRDNVEVLQRVNLQVDAVVSETLSGTVNFEMGDGRWGWANEGAALGADGVGVKVKSAYLDWMVPNLDLSVRMGIQGFALPSFSVANPVLHNDMAGIVVNYKFTESVSLTGAWLRLLNDNWGGRTAPSTGGGFASTSPAGYMDNFDLAAFTLPVKLDGVRVTPWAMGGAMGPNSNRPAVAATNPNALPLTGTTVSTGTVTVPPIDSLQLRYGLMPAAFSSGRSTERLFSDDYTTTAWGGLGLEVTAAEPWRFTGDVMYGNVGSSRNYLNRSGWFGMVLGEYKASWGTPGLYAWYFSGDDGDVSNGSESFPYISTTNNLVNALSSFGYRGSATIGGGKGVLGTNPNGTWGVGARVTNLSFLENVSHVLRLNVFGGSHDTKMASYITGRQTQDGSGRAVYRTITDFNTFGTYLTTADSGLEVNFDTSIKVYDNLRFVLEMAYIHLWLDDSVWGRYGNLPGNTLNYKDAWKVTVGAFYSF